jgi:hypothetical protein
MIYASDLRSITFPASRLVAKHLYCNLRSFTALLYNVPSSGWASYFQAPLGFGLLLVRVDDLVEPIELGRLPLSGL